MANPNIQFRIDAVLGDTTQLQQKLQKQLDNIKTSLTISVDNQKALEAIKAVRDEVKKLKSEMGNIKIGSGVKIDNSTKNYDQEITKNYNRTLNRTVNNNSLISGVKVQQQIANVAQGMSNNIASSAEDSKVLNANVISIEQNMGNVRKDSGGLKDNADKSSNSFNLMDRALENIGRHMIYMAFGEIVQSIREGVDYLKDYDEALTNIRIVTMGTREETEKLLSTYNQIGQNLGASTMDVASGAVDWLRQGYSQDDTNTLVQDSIILSKLALIDSADATEYLTSAIKGYKLEAKDAIGVIDQLVSIDLVAATSASDLSEAMSRTANMARTTGIEMNQLLGMIAATAEVTQNSASVVGNSMKTILSRMSNVAAGKELDDAGEKINDVEKSLDRVGIKLRKNEKEWRNYYDVLDEVASKWSTFTDIEKSQVTTALGGKQKPSAVTYSNVWCLAV